jgi:hypothetical protein
MNAKIKTIGKLLEDALKDIDRETEPFEFLGVRSFGRTTKNWVDASVNFKLSHEQWQRLANLVEKEFGGTGWKPVEVLKSGTIIWE